MIFSQSTIELAPLPRGFHLVTNEIIAQAPDLQNCQTGLLHLFLQHTSASLTINENADPDVPIDLEASLNAIAPEDFPSLGAYELYASLYADGQVRPYAAGSSLPPGPPTANPAALRIRSQSLYGRPLSQIDAGFADLLGGTPNATDAPTGRRRRGGAE